MQTSKKKKWTHLVFVFFICLMIFGTVRASKNGKVEPTKLKQVLPLAVQKLFTWPSQSILKGEGRVGGESAEILYPKKQCLLWLKKTFSPLWLPGDEIDFIFIRDEFDGRDVVRASWERNGYSIQVSQTASIFTIKLTPVKNVGLGVDKRQKTDKTKKVCLDIFNDVGMRWTLDEIGARTKVEIKGFNKKIASYSFKPELSKHLKDDNSAWGRPKTKLEAKVKRPTDEDEYKKQIDPNYPDWENTEFAYNYWFRKINWFNDGKSMGFYFLKVEDGSWIPSYGANFDKTFFRVR